MDITSFYFISFFLVLFICFYSVPVRFQWIILLGGSLFFYGYSGVKNICFVLLTAIISFFSGLILQTITWKNRQDFEMLLHQANNKYKENYHE